VSGDIFTKWEEKEEAERKRKKERMVELAGGQAERGKGRAHVRNTSKSSVMDVSKNKAKASGDGGSVDAEEEGLREDNAETLAQQDLGPLIVLACRHIYHQSCLEAVQVEDSTGHDGSREFRCPIDG
jgi:hypothetical protein